MTPSTDHRQARRALFGTAVLFLASQGLLVILYTWSNRLGGYRWDPDASFGAPPVVPLASYPWASWAAFLAATAVFPVAWERLAGKRSPADIGLRSPRAPLREAALAALGTVLFLAYMMAILRLLHQSLPHVLTAGNAAFFALQWCAVGGGEEVLYRGVLQRRVADAAGVLPGILIASVVWAVVGHVREPLLENLAVRFPAGLLLGYLYSRSRSLYPPILAHWTMNIAVTAGL